MHRRCLISPLRNGVQGVAVLLRLPRDNADDAAGSLWEPKHQETPLALNDDDSTGTLSWPARSVAIVGVREQARDGGVVSLFVRTTVVVGRRKVPQSRDRSSALV